MSAARQSLRSCATYLFARKVDAHGAVLEQLDGELVGGAGHARDDHVAARDDVLERLGHVLHVVHLLADALAAREALDARDVDAPDVGAVVGEQGGERAADNLGAVDDGDGAAVVSGGGSGGG